MDGLCNAFFVYEEDEKAGKEKRPQKEISDFFAVNFFVHGLDKRAGVCYNENHIPVSADKRDDPCRK